MEQLNALVKNFVDKINPTLVHIRKSFKNIKTEKTKIKYMNILIEEVNKFIECVQKNKNLNKSDQAKINNNWSIIVESLSLASKRLQYKFEFDANIFSQRCIKKLKSESDEGDDPGDDIEEEDDLDLEDTITFNPETNEKEEDSKKEVEIEDNLNLEDTII